MTEILMPRLSDSMEEGTIVAWLRAHGEVVQTGDEIAEIESDKATVSFQAEHAGVLSIVLAEGESAAVGAPIAVIGDAAVGGRPATGVARARADRPATAEESETSSPEPRAGRVPSSPMARRLAREHGIELQALTGSGPRGRIVRADVERAAAPTGNAPAPGPAGASRGEITVVQPSRAQATIAARMAESRNDVPSFEVGMDADLTELLALRRQWAAQRGAAPSVNDFIIRACALALRGHPLLNAVYRKARFELYGRVNVGFAVAGEQTLLVPTVFDADQRSMEEIRTTTGALVEKARGGSITPAELGGGTFTISNLGMFGVAAFTAVINPGQSAILSIGAAEAQPRLVGGTFEERHVARLTLTCDHRIVYGADAARFAASVRERLEAPLRLVQ